MNTKYRSKHNKSSRIFTTCGYSWPMKTLDPDYLVPTQFSKIAKGLADFACACVYVKFHFHAGNPLLLAFVLALVLA